MAAPRSEPTLPKKSAIQLMRESWPMYAELFQYMRPYRRRFFAGLFCGVMFAVLNNGLLPFIVRHVTAEVIPGGGNQADLLKVAASNSGPALAPILFACIAIPLVMTLRSVFDYLNAYCMAWVSLKVLMDIRRKLFAQITRQSLDFFNKSRSGQLISRVSNDTRMAQSALATLSSDLIKQPFAVLVGISSLVYMDWKFSIISLILFPACIVPVAIYGRKVRKSGKDEENEAGMMMVILQETFAGIRVIKSFAREEYQSQQFEESSRAQFRNSMRVRRAMEIVGPLVEVVASAGAAMALLYVYFAQLSAATFLALMAGIFLLYNPVKQLSRVHIQMQKCLAATTNIFELMKMEPTIQDRAGALDFARARGELVFENVCFGYLKGVPAVSNVSLEVEAGKTYALVGASGAGKSTLLSLILRFYDPTSGVIRLDGHDLRDVTQKSLRENIGIVTQETFLFHESIFRNIHYGRFEATPEEVYAAARQAFAHDFIMAQPQGYETVVGDKGCLISGGQQQRLAIARALLKNAPILLLDEATSALDSESEKQIQSALETLSSGRTVIAIAHRLSTILRADQIVVMDRGLIREVGTHRELFAQSGLYRRLYDLQFHREEEFGPPPAEPVIVATAALA